MPAEYRGMLRGRALSNSPFLEIDHVEEVVWNQLRLAADQAVELGTNLRPDRRKHYRGSKKPFEISLDCTEIVLRRPVAVEGRVLHNADDMRRADPDGSIRHSFEHLRMVGNQNVARRDLVARQPGHLDGAEQSR